MLVCAFNMEKALVGLLRVKHLLQLYKNTIVTCLTLDGEPDVVRDDGGGGDLALVLAAVRPSS